MYTVTSIIIYNIQHAYPLTSIFSLPMRLLFKLLWNRFNLRVYERKEKISFFRILRHLSFRSSKTVYLLGKNSLVNVRNLYLRMLKQAKDANKL